jgi:DnaJ-class molecular chaperone
MKTLYEQLGVTPMASQTAIQQSFFRLVKKVDPAHAPRPGAEHARTEYTALQNAYRTLSNCQSRGLRPQPAATIIQPGCKKKRLAGGAA